MKLITLLRRNLRFHRRGNFAVFLGVAVGTAVLTGALLVGDSLTGSLRGLTERRLSWIHYTMLPGRFFRERNAPSFLPAVALQGAAQSTPAGAVRRAPHVSIWGVSGNFWIRQQDQILASQFWFERLFDRWRRDPDFIADDRGLAHLASDGWDFFAPGAVLSESLAVKLGVRPGDTITLSLRKPSAVPRETLLGRRGTAEALQTLKIKVLVVLPRESFYSHFSLAPSAVSPLNVFVPLSYLQEQLGTAGQANAILAAGYDRSSHERVTKVTKAFLDDWITKGAILDDWGLVLYDPEERARSLFAKLDRNKDGQLSRSEWRGHIARVLADCADPKTGVLTREAVVTYYQKRGYLSLESKQMLLEPAVVDAAMQAAKECKLMAAPTLVYLANRISTRGKEVPYSVVAALDPSLPPPLGPFLPTTGVPLPHRDRLKDNEIVIINWKDLPFSDGPGSSPVVLHYFRPEQEGRLEEKSESFHLAGFISPYGVADDPDLTPEFPGITDKLSLKDWDPPFPYDNKRVKKRDEDYWDEYRTTPKAYIPLKKGQELWGSRFGSVTSIRLAPAAGQDLMKAAKEFQTRLLANLDPKKGGFVFEDVRARGLQASAGGTNFSYLFLGFSFFLIAAALLLVGLLFRLNIDRRASEIGLLQAAGYRCRTVRRLLLAEGGIIAALGGLVGCLIAVGYAWGLLELLRAWWPGAMDRSFLTLHVSWQSVLIGYFASVAVSLLTIAWAVRVLGKTSPSALLAGETSMAQPTAAEPTRCWGGWVALACGLLGIGLIGVGNLVPDAEARAGTFFGGGFFLLSAGLSAVWFLMRRREHLEASSPRLGISTLAIRNASRHPARSLLTAGLLASAAFLIVAVESFRKQPEADFHDKNSGSGGFALLGESDVPIYQDLNKGPGHDELTEALERAKVSPDGLGQVTFFPFRLRAGDDASCLNLYKPGRPRLLGVPHALVERGGFHFKDTVGKPEEPWKLLEQQQPDGAIPVFGEANTVQWMLGKSLGDTIDVPDEHGQTVRLRIVGTLQDSIFQSELLMSEASFLRLYPRQEGYSFFLIETPTERAGEVRGLLDTALADRGFEATPTASRLASYLAVENMYLSTFQALGGLGLMLGALGLAVVMLRSVWERRGELALLRALGYRQRMLGRLVFAENGLLLAAGLGIGTAAALLAVLPHVLGAGGEVPWLHITALLALVVLIGLGAGGWAMRATVRAPLLPALRRE